MKKILLIPSLLTIATTPLISMSSCGDKKIKPTDIFINKNEIALVVGETIKLNAAVEPEEFTQEVEWSTSNPAVCTVKNGEVTGVADGTATITVKPKGYDDISATCTVNVIPPSDVIELDFYNDQGKNYWELLSNQLILPKDTIIKFRADFSVVTSTWGVSWLALLQSVDPYSPRGDFTLLNLYVNGTEVPEGEDTWEYDSYSKYIIIGSQLSETLMDDDPICTGTIKANEDVTGFLAFYYAD